MDAELAQHLASLPPIDFWDVAAERARRAASLAGAAPLPGELAERLGIEDREIPAGSRPRVRLYRPRTDEAACAAVIWIHGGGFVVGGVADDHEWAADLAAATGALVVSVEYRLAPEHRFPAALDDCQAALNWLTDQADRLGVDRRRIAVAGSSAGAGLAAAVTLRARDRGEPLPRFQMLNHPILDDRMTTISITSSTDTPNLNRDNVAAAWRHYLGHTATPGAQTSPYAAPARADDLSGLPPAYVATSEHDPLRDEGILYALRLLQAGVSVELHQFPGTFHGSQGLPAAVSQRQNTEITRAIRHGLRPPPR